MDPLIIVAGLVVVGVILAVAVLRGGGSSQNIEERLNELAALG